MKINPTPETEKIVRPMNKTQKEWKEYFKQERVKQISLPDIYREANNEKLMVSLREDFKSILLTGSRINYHKDDMKADIFHPIYDKKGKITEKIYKDVLVPAYSGDFKEDDVTEKFLQAIWNTTDKLKIILEKIKKISKKEIMRLWTPSQSSRKSVPLRCVSLFDGGGFSVRFDVGCDGYDGGSGRSRRVQSDSEPKARSKGGRKNVRKKRS